MPGRGPRRIEGSRRGTQMTKAELFDKWFSERVEVLRPDDPRAYESIKTSDLYQDNTDWLEKIAAGGLMVEQFSQVGFGLALSYKGYRAHKNNTYSVRRGLALRPWQE